MLQGQSDSQQRQLYDVLAFEIIPRLSLLDAQSLGQTCSSLWNLLKMDLPSSTFRSLANNTFPPGHPMLAVDDVNLQTEIEELAATHASIRSGHAASVSISCFPQCGRPCDTAIALNHAGDYALRGRNHKLELCRCNMDVEPMSMEVVWQQAAPARHADDDSAPRFFWSPDDRWACIWYDLWDFGDDELFMQNASSPEAMYVWDLETKDIHQVLADSLLVRQPGPCFSPDSKIMLLPWHSSVTTIDIYNWRRRQITAHVCDPSSRQLGGGQLLFEPFVVQIRFSPDSLRFAVTRNDDVRIYDQDGVLHLVLRPHMVPNPPASLMNGQVAWSPTGSRIAFWHPATTEKLHIFHVPSGLEEVVKLAEHDTAVNCAGLLWGCYGPLPVFEPLRKCNQVS